MAMARLLLSIFIILGFGIELNYGQSASEAANWPLEVTDFQVAIVSTTQLQGSMNMGMGGNMGMSGASPVSTKVGEQKLTFLLKSKNPSATQTVACIQWESRFTNSHQDVVVKQFKTKKKIKPSKDEMIEESIFYDSKLIPGSMKVGFRIIKIEFTDGTPWENASKDSETSYIYKTISIK